MSCPRTSRGPSASSTEVLLDTHIVLWWISGDVSRIPPSVVDTLSRPDAVVTVSAVVLWEAAIKRGLGNLDPPLPDLLERLEATDVELLPVSPSHADRVGTLPLHHRDPFDRLLVAQAQVERLPIVTVDPWIEAYEVDVVR